MTITAILNVKRIESRVGRIGLSDEAPAKAGGSIMTNAMRRNVLPCLMIAVGLGLSQTAYADGYNPVTQQAQSKLATLGHDPGPLDGIAG